MTLNLDFVKNAVQKFFEEHLLMISAETLEWLSIIVIHCATVPTLLAMMTGLTDRAPSLDIIMFVWGALLLMFIRAIILKNSLNIITNGFGFISQAVIMAFILFR
jgi:hypothetical protein